MIHNKKATILTTIAVIIAAVALFLNIKTTYTSSSYTYERRELGKHIIHIVTMCNYKADIVKANEGTIGRETVSSIAKRSGAEIAINGGFFQIGPDQDGKASGTLFIKGKKYNAKDIIQALLIIENGKISISLDNHKNFISSTVSMLSGIPLLIQEGEIAQGIIEKDSKFYKGNHARTAVGIRPDGTAVIVVAEHHYSKSLGSITTGEIESLMHEKGKLFAAKYKHSNPGEITLNELKQILREEFISQGGALGLTIMELATLMKELGCHYAINLDGGGSSTLWVKDKVVNSVIGDNDESNGLQVERPVSDAIIFKMK